jgi:hypothetical protein
MGSGNTAVKLKRCCHSRGRYSQNAVPHFLTCNLDMSGYLVRRAEDLMQIDRDVLEVISVYIIFFPYFSLYVITSS